jgi:Tol biopolymer transport system component
MRADGSHLRQLTHAAGNSGSPDWSPDGRRIALESDRSGHDEIYTMRRDGTDVRRLTHTAPGVANRFPAYSPDGRVVVFSRCFASGVCSIFAIDARGAHERRLTNTATQDFEPQFSPDGSRLVFERIAVRHGTTTSALYLAASDGSHVTRLTPFAVGAGSPDWSPSGLEIVFESNLTAPHSSLFTIRPDGTGLRQLTDPPSRSNDALASFSPRGDTIAFASDRGGSGGIWEIQPNGGNLHRVTSAQFCFACSTDWGSRVLH